jgi:ubiquinone/menaquinone biosynthesis C-methylase UbiE
MATVSNETKTTQPDTAMPSLIRVLDTADTMPGAAELRAHTYDLLALAPGQAVVDVGCGTGRAVAELADRGTRPIGIDISEQMITTARRRWPKQDFRLGSADAPLPLADNSVAGYRADKVLHELPDPRRPLTEARRVLVAGGRIILVGQDWDAFIIDSDQPNLTRTLVQARADTIPNPRAARQYRNLLLDAGFSHVTVEVRTPMFTDAAMLPLLTDLAESASAAGHISRDQTDTWIAEQTRRAHDGRLFMAIPLFLAAATRP